MPQYTFSVPQWMEPFWPRTKIAEVLHWLRKMAKFLISKWRWYLFFAIATVALGIITMIMWPYVRFHYVPPKPEYAPVNSIESNGPFGRIGVLADYPREADARELITSITDKCAPLMTKRGWEIPELIEVPPTRPLQYGIWQRSALGFNLRLWSTWQIGLKLRWVKGGRVEFWEEPCVTHTLLHEMAHIEYGNHGDKFHALLAELVAEYDSSYGTNLTRSEEDLCDRRLIEGGVDMA